MAHAGRLQGRIAVVTGSNSGIGRGIALAYGREGATVVCVGRQAESKNKNEQDFTTDALIVKNGGTAVFMKALVTETDSVNKLVSDVVAKYGRIDIWVNNAGGAGEFNSIWAMTDEAFEYTINLNLMGFFRCIRAASAQMIKQDIDRAGLRGRIINLSSVFGPRGFPMSAAYSASKLGVTGMVRAAAMDLSPHRVTINSICPGTIVTNATSELPEEANRFLDQKALLGRGQPEDVAGVALMLASDDGKWMQGAEVFIDGGYTVS